MTTRKKIGYSLVGVLGVLVLGVSVFHFFLRKNARPPSQLRQSADAIVAATQAKLDTGPKTANLYLTLGNAYLQKVRETADVSYYTKALDAMDAAEKIDPTNQDVLAVRASIALGKHHFNDGLEIAQKIIRARPTHAGYYGFLVDAYNELGEYTKAATALQIMVDLHPDYSSYSRISYVRELHGDITGAEQAMAQAISAGSVYPENIAWAYMELGNLFMRTSVDDAVLSYNKALEFVPNYPPALEGLGKVAFFKGNYDEARAKFQDAFSRIPIAQYAIDLGDVYTHQGDSAKAKQYYYLARLAFEKSSANGVDTDLETAVFLADHDTDLPLALTKAETAYKNRPGIYGANALAWALYKNGRPKDAVPLLKKSLQLGEHDPLLTFYAGIIQNAAGNFSEAKRLLSRALDLNPNFSLQYASVARETVRKLTTSS